MDENLKFMLIKIEPHLTRHLRPKGNLQFIHLDFSEQRNTQITLIFTLIRFLIPNNSVQKVNKLVK